MRPPGFVDSPSAAGGSPPRTPCSPGTPCRGFPPGTAPSGGGCASDSPRCSGSPQSSQSGPASAGSRSLEATGGHAHQQNRRGPEGPFQALLAKLMLKVSRPVSISSASIMTTVTEPGSFCLLTFQVFNDFNVVQGQVQILQLLQVSEILWKRKRTKEDQR